MRRVGEIRTLVGDWLSRAIIGNPCIGSVAILVCLFAAFCPLTALFNADIAAKLMEIDNMVERAAYVFEHNSKQGVILLIVGLSMVLFSAFTAFRISKRYRDPQADPIEAPALIFTVFVCVCVFVATLALLNNPILWAFGILIACMFGFAKLFD